MKQNLLIITLTGILLFSISNARAQNENREASTPPKWTPENGYWIVESNVKMPRLATLYFYNNENVLVYREKVEGVKINLKNRKTKMLLKNILDQSLALYKERKRTSENEMLAKNIIAGK